MMDRLNKLSKSEKRLALMVVALLGAAVAMVATVRCWDVLDTLDATIESQQLALIEATKDAALAGPVEAAFETMAKQHSSQWTQEQIHDRLRVEIARLSLRDVPQEGTPIPAVTQPGALLVDIRSWPLGALDESGEGYRTYQINFRTEPTSIQNIAVFLERLQQSPQALRVDGLELTRQPLSTEVTAAFRVTRTVIGSAGAPRPKVAEADKGPKNLARNADFAMWNEEKAQAFEWTASNASLVRERNFAAIGDTALAVNAQAPNAEFYQVQLLKSGATYDVQFNAKVSGAARMRIVDDGAGSPLQGDAPLTPGPTAYRYRYRFTVPGQGGTRVAMRVPAILLESPGTVLEINNVSLEEYRAR